MGAPYFELKNASVSSSNLAEAITFVIPDGSNFYLKEISISPDSAFVGGGSFIIEFNGQIFMTSPESLPAALTIPLWTFNKLAGMLVKPRDKIKISARMSSGTGIISASLLGESTSDEVI